MKERLEQFINSNRDAFDDETPPALIWEEVNKNLCSEKKVAKVVQLQRLKFWAAAVVVAIIGSVVFLIVENNQLKKDLTASKQQLEQQLEQPDLVTLDHRKEINQFMQVVAAKQSQLSGIRREYPSLYKSFTTDINELNEVYNKLKQELAFVPEKDEILDAMIQNLKLQAELLNEQLLIIQQLKSSKKHSNETTTPII